MNLTLTQLSSNGISTLFTQKQLEQPIAVQIVQFQIKKNKVYFYISDGNFKLKATTKQQDMINPNIDLNLIILIKTHLFFKNVVGIIDFDKLFNYKHTIGKPQLFTENTMNPQNINTNIIQKQLIIGYKQPQTQKKQIKQTQTSQKQNPTISQPSQKKPIVQVPVSTLSGNLKDYQTIKTLYIGMQRWTIVCRIVKKQYRQFISKGGKQTKTLNIQLMDRAGMKIAGVFFGQAANSFNDILVENRVYKISKAQIRQQSYNNSKNQKISPYKLVFTNLSSFQEVSDTNSVAKNQDSAITLGQCVENKIIGQQFDIICVLTKIQDSIQIKKDDKPSKKTNMLVADPIKNITLYAVLWNQNLKIPYELIGKSIILSRFKLSEYKGSLTLNSNYRSNIIAVKDHVYQQYQNKVMSEYEDYQKLQQIKITSTSNNSNQVCKNLKELEARIQQLDYDQWARADVTIYINKFNLKKWHYQGCPHCNKSAESFGNCPHCQKYIQKTVGHFILGVQVCDSTGSLWTTAYNQWARQIFHVQNHSIIIQQLLKLNADQLKQKTQAYLYQEYRLRISTKKDKQGKIKHTVSKVYERNYIDQTQKTLQMINKLLIQ